MQKTVYEPHPVSPERKAELRAMGVRLVDARFKPAPIRAEDVRLPARDEIASMPRVEVVEWLEAHGVDSPKGKVADLRLMLERAIYL